MTHMAVNKAQGGTQAVFCYALIVVVMVGILLSQSVRLLGWKDYSMNEIKTSESLANNQLYSVMNILQQFVALGLQCTAIVTGLAR